MDHADNLKATYNRQAVGYDASRSNDLFERKWLDRFIALLPEGAHATELGCGAGDPVAVHLVENGFHVWGIDASQAMLALAKEKLPRQCWVEGDLRHLSLGKTFDGLLAFNSLFHLTLAEQRHALPVILSHANPQCVFMTTTGTDEGEAWGLVEGEKVYHGSLSMAEYKGILNDAGFEVLDHRTDPQCNDHMLLLAQRDERKTDK